MSEDNALAKYIKAYRYKENLTQKEMAKRIGISKYTISLIERMQSNPTLETMQEIAACIGVSVSDLLNVD